MLASQWGNGGVEVLSTPHLVGLFEQTAIMALEGQLAEGESTVGTVVNIRHLKASPLGASVTVVAEVTEIDRRRLVFKVEARNEDGTVVGDGLHERFVINRQRFTEKTYGGG